MQNFENMLPRISSEPAVVRDALGASGEQPWPSIDVIQRKVGDIAVYGRYLNRAVVRIPKYLAVEAVEYVAICRHLDCGSPVFVIR